MDIEKQLLDSENPVFGIYQLRNDDALQKLAYRNLNDLINSGYYVERGNYDLVYTASLEADLTPRQLFANLSVSRPESFKGRVMSVSDVITINNGKYTTSLYVDGGGFKEIPGFLSYKKLLRRYSDENYTTFKEKMLELPPERIYGSAYKITDYNLLSGFFCGDFDLSESTCKFLCGQEAKVLDYLYHEYLSYDCYSLENDESIADFINDVRAGADSSFFEEEEEME